MTGEVWVGGRLPSHTSPEDLDLHLTTLFPPVRPRGYLELRCLDALPTRWWPAVVAVTTALMDDPVGADLAVEAAEPADSLWTQAARHGLAEPRLADAAARCLHIAADRVPTELRQAVADLVDLVESGRTPGDLLAERFRTTGPHTTLRGTRKGVADRPRRTRDAFPCRVLETAIRVRTVRRRVNVVRHGPTAISWDW